MDPGPRIGVRGKLRRGDEEISGGRRIDRVFLRFNYSSLAAGRSLRDKATLPRPRKNSFHVVTPAKTRVYLMGARHAG